MTSTKRFAYRTGTGSRGRFIAERPGADHYYCTNGDGEGLFLVRAGADSQMAGTSQFRARTMAEFARKLRARLVEPDPAAAVRRLAAAQGHGGRRSGAGRPAIGPEVKIDLPESVILAYDSIAAARGQTRAAAMREALTAWLAMEQAADRLGA